MSLKTIARTFGVLAFVSALIPHTAFAAGGASVIRSQTSFPITLNAPGPLNCAGQPVVIDANLTINQTTVIDRAGGINNSFVITISGTGSLDLSDYTFDGVERISFQGNNAFDTTMQFRSTLKNTTNPGDIAKTIATFHTTFNANGVLAVDTSNAPITGTCGQ